jgi:hypothetical protein
VLFPLALVPSMAITMGSSGMDNLSQWAVVERFTASGRTGYMVTSLQGYMGW